MPEERIREYIIEGLIGRGGMGSVYLARHVHLGTKAALKVLLEQYSDDPTLKERFINEARILADLQHPNIVLQKEFFEEHGRLVLVMEYVDGRGLDRMIGQEVGPIPWEKALPLFMQILDGIGYAHSKGVIHRDIKPSNILVSREGRVKITDLGIAKIAGQKGLTRTGTQMGTLYYESPEQIRGAKEVDLRSDIYSLGMTLYEMLAGRLPFETGEDTTEFEITQTIVFKEFDPPTVFYPDIPQWLVEVVGKATAKLPEDRYQSCAEFQSALGASGTAGSPELIECVRHEPAAPSRGKGKPSASAAPAARKRGVKAAAGSSENWKRIAIILAGLVAASALLWLIPWDRGSSPVVPDSHSVEDTTDPLTLMTFVQIPSGSFIMGSLSSETGREENESPQHAVTIEGFELMSTEVTQELWESVMGSNPAHDNGVGDDCPVYFISWYDCKEFIDTLSELDSLYDYRLPTEAEWEYACRAGSTTAFYWRTWMRDEYCWYASNSNSRVQPVGQTSPNDWGLYDMSGNVWEWCEDWYHDDYSGAPCDGSAWLVPAGEFRVFRGGSWFFDAEYCRSANRGRNLPEQAGDKVGLRLVRMAEGA